MVAERKDPAAEKQASKIQYGLGSDLFSAVAAEFVERHVKRNTRASSARQTERWLAKEVLPKWGNKRIQEITKRHVLDLLDGIVDRGGGLSANRVLAAVRKLFNWAVQRGIITISPAAGIKAPLAETSRDRVLSDDEIRWTWLACDRLAYPFGSMAKILLLTGQRRNEVSGMTWDELDLDKALWRIPGGRTKNDEAHEVPLSDAALSVIASLPRIKSNKGYLFTTNAETHVSGYSRAKSMLDKAMLEIARDERAQDVEIPRWTFHDLRRTAVSCMARLGIALPVIEKVVNHSSGSFAGIVGVYQRHSFADEKRTALQAWANFVLSTVERRPANVVSIKAVR
jgi:integrase